MKPTGKSIKKFAGKKSGASKPRVVQKRKTKGRARLRPQETKTVSGQPYLKKTEHNPILKPDESHPWESYQTFNPAALYAGDKIHLLYRALGADGISRLGYAASNDGLTIIERSAQPIYTAPKPDDSEAVDEYAYPIIYESGGGCGGCEDPRMVRIDDRVFITFVAFDGWGSVQIALTSLDLNDFLAQKWKWKKPILISPPGEVHKNWVLFPEKIKGKYAILHSIAPKVLVEYVDNLESLDGNTHITSIPGNRVAPKGRAGMWLRGSGPPPIKTTYGWLLLCHAMDTRDPNRYKLGAMILDMEDPTKILYQSTEPILEPDEVYENQGHKAGVIYSCGAVVVDGRLFVYYGGADTVVCVATADLEQFLQVLIHQKKPKLKAVHMRKQRLS